MKPADVYQRIQETAPDDLPDRILGIIRQHTGKDNRITRRELVEQVFGIRIEAGDDISNSTYDRQIRDVLAELQKNHPIISSSGEGGYWYPGDMDEVLTYSNEIMSRARKLFEKSRRLEAAARREFNIPPQMKLL